MKLKEKKYFDPRIISPITSVLACEFVFPLSGKCLVINRKKNDTRWLPNFMIKWTKNVKKKMNRRPIFNP